MPQTYPNQRLITIHKPKYNRDFLQVANQEWMKVNKTLCPYGLQLYLYLAANADNYEFALSPQDAENEAGIKPTSFRKYFALLEKEGYIVWKGGNHYEFYTSPRDESERTNSCSPNADAPRKLTRNDEGISFDDTPISPCEQTPSQSDIEKDNIYTFPNKIDIYEETTRNERPFAKFSF